jgi:hypothetical protein
MKYVGLVLLGTIGWGIWSQFSNSNLSSRLSEGGTGDVKFMETGDRQGTPVLMTVQKSGTGFTFVPIEAPSNSSIKPNTPPTNDELKTEKPNP